MRHLLLTADFPPKVGGIQSYLWELWRRLDPATTAVLTTDHPGSRAFDALAPMKIWRLGSTVALPTPEVARRARQAIWAARADLVVVDPALPLGWLAPELGRPYVVVLHGAEVTVPARLPGSGLVLRRVLQGALGAIAAGPYPARIAEEVAGSAMPPVAIVPPGVDTQRFRPLDEVERARARAALGLPTGPLVLSVSRLVPRKGMDILIEAIASLRQRGVVVDLAIAGEGRDRPRLERLAARLSVPVRFLGRVGDEDLPRLYGCADLFAMCCRDRWMGLEQEGFGIVFVEAAAAGVPQVAGSSGGAEDAVLDGRTGLVVRHPRSPRAVAEALGSLLADSDRRASLGRAARARAEAELDYDRLAEKLAASLEHFGALATIL